VRNRDWGEYLPGLPCEIIVHGNKMCWWERVPVVNFFLQEFFPFYAHHESTTTVVQILKGDSTRIVNIL